MHTLPHAAGWSQLSLSPPLTRSEGGFSLVPYFAGARSSTAATIALVPSTTLSRGAT